MISKIVQGNRSIVHESRTKRFARIINKTLINDY